MNNIFREIKYYLFDKFVNSYLTIDNLLKDLNT